MKKFNIKNNFMFIMLIAVLILGVGYAAVTNITLYINGGATSKGNASDEDFEVRFVQNSDVNSEFNDVSTAANHPASYEVSNGSTAEVNTSVVDDTNATFAITGLTSVGEYVTLTYYVTNMSEGLPAYVYVDVFNSSNDQNEYFKITRTVSNSELLTKGSVTPVTVKVEVVSLPKFDKTGNFTVKLVASDTKKSTVGTSGVSSVYTTASTTNEISELFSDSNIDNLKVTLTDDVSYGNNVVSIPEGKNVILDLNGNDFTGSFIVTGDLTIEGDGTITGSTASDTSIFVVDEDSTVTINGGEYISTTYYGLNVDGGSVIINDGVFHTKECVFGSNNNAGDMNLVINGGTFTADNGFVIYMPTPGTITVNDGTLNGGISFRMGTVNINGGVINATSGEIDSYTQYYGFSGEAWFGDAIEVLGGTYTVGANSNAANNDAILIITGGTINSNNGTGTALVVQNLGKVEQNVTVNISGGTFGTNASGRSTFEIKDADDFNATAVYKTYTNYINVNITGGTGLTGVIASGNYLNTTTFNG